MIVKMIRDLGSKPGATIDKLQERLNKETEDLRIKQAEMQNTLTEIKNSLEAANSRIQEAEEQISEVEDRLSEITDVEQKKEKRLKRNEDSLREFWEKVKYSHVHVIGVPEEKRERKCQRKYMKR